MNKLSLSILAKRFIKIDLHKCVLSTALSLISTLTFAATVNVATEPLVNSVPPLALPNLMYILDNSGSMSWEHTPDWVAEANCKAVAGINVVNCGNPTDPQYTGHGTATTADDDQLPDGAPPYRSPDYNNQYYNPAVRYTPAVDYAGTTKGNQVANNAKYDAYDIRQTGNVNLVSNFSDIEWCTSNTPTDCLTNDNYVLPGIVNGKNYNVQNKTLATGTKTLATGILAANLSNKAVGPHYYKIIPGEFCDSARLTNCQTSQTTVFKFPAKLRWCDSTSLSNCQSLKTGAFQYARYPTAREAVLGISTLTISNTNDSTSVSSIMVGTTQLLSATTVSTNDTTTLANSIVANINPATGYTAVRDGSIVNIYAPVTATLAPKPVIIKNGNKTITPSVFSAITVLGAVVPGSFERVDIVPGTATYPRTSARTDCIASTTTCTYNEELVNFANWFSYYRTRIQMMKTSTSLAFKTIGEKYRLGFVTINMQQYLPIDKFSAGAGNQKDTWYGRLFAANPRNGTGTMLRSALANVGRLYAGKKPVGTVDPVQYSCQQNYALLTTDGYWNVDTDADVKDIAGTGQVGNQDIATSNAPEISEGPTVTNNTLADVARYYYNTDLRTSGNSNCTGGARPNGTTGDVCTNDVFTSPSDEKEEQHMTTFTLGLGIDGSIAYTSDYKDAKSGDYYNIVNSVLGAVWPVPVQNTETAVDDLWHAAVNGNGTYFSAKDPEQLSASLTKALTEIGSSNGAAASAATSTLNPVAANNLAFLATYTTSAWSGNIEAREINTVTGVINEQAKWCAEDIGVDKCANNQSPVSIASDTSGAKYCVVANSTATSCDAEGGSLAGTNCNIQAAAAVCTGTMTQSTRASPTQTSTLVAALTDNRNIYFQGIDGTGNANLVSFTAANLALASKANNYQTTYLSTVLSQWSALSSDQQALVTPENLVKYLRGQNGFEDTETNLVGTTDYRIFRKRESVLGDVLESTPAYIGKTTSVYLDEGYSGFKTNQTSRDGVVYVAANDGMLHAFDATNTASAGKERWAFIPTAVLPDLYKLADKEYSANHKNYLNGDIYISDICSANCSDATNAVWKTILVMGQNGGGKTFIALDITDPGTSAAPNAPILLWEFSNATPFLASVTKNGTATSPDLGLTFGAPIITKNASGIWVALLTSGYNNANGKGHMYVLNANTGEVISDYETSAGTAASPSGLAKISAYAANADTNNTTLYVYGGDLEGNLWRFDLATAPSSSNPFLFATLKAGTVAQPITTAPEIGIINDVRVVFVGTGKYLEPNDLNDKTSQQTIYAIKDNNATATLVNPRSQTTIMVQQTITQNATNTTRSIATNAVAITKRGWFIDLNDPGERQNINAKLVLGTLQFATTVPTAGACNPGGYGWFNYVDYRTGGSVSSAITGKKISSPPVGQNTVYINGVPKTSVVDSQGNIKIDEGVPYIQTITGFQKRRVIWRELLDPEQ